MTAPLRLDMDFKKGVGSSLCLWVSVANPVGYGTGF